MLCQGHFFSLEKIVGLSLFLLVVTRFCFNYVLFIRLKMRRAALIANTFLFLQLLLLCYDKQGDLMVDYPKERSFENSDGKSNWLFPSS